MLVAKLSEWVDKLYFTKRGVSKRFDLGVRAVLKSPLDIHSKLENHYKTTPKSSLVPNRYYDHLSGNDATRSLRTLSCTSHLFILTFR